ncbi:hypothetical protein ACFOOK_16175 [Micromonospora krabiensis]|uniref:hypothetical protein n=1 Tax=Micromonospora krabiensis TaxID=307121 RepID=UPI00155F55D8|nr:hypothetical protein [Micromonospora krabiensis]
MAGALAPPGTLAPAEDGPTGGAPRRAEGPTADDTATGAAGRGGEPAETADPAETAKGAAPAGAADPAEVAKGAAASGAAETGAPDMSAPDTGAADTEAPETGTPEACVAGAGPADSAAAGTGAADSAAAGVESGETGAGSAVDAVEPVTPRNSRAWSTLETIRNASVPPSSWASCLRSAGDDAMPMINDATGIPRIPHLFRFPTRSGRLLCRRINRRHDPNGALYQRG